MNRLTFPEQQWYDGLLLDEFRHSYDGLTKDQKKLIRFAYIYGRLHQQQITQIEQATKLEL